MRKKKGFTLAELLIVVAIIGVLVAISIPIFTDQLKKARQATNWANMRAAYAAAIADYLSNDRKETSYVRIYNVETGKIEMPDKSNSTNFPASDSETDGVKLLERNVYDKFVVGVSIENENGSEYAKVSVGIDSGYGNESDMIMEWMRPVKESDPINNMPGVESKQTDQPNQPNQSDQTNP